MHHYLPKWCFATTRDTILQWQKKLRLSLRLSKIVISWSTRLLLGYGMTRCYFWHWSNHHHHHPKNSSSQIHQSFEQKDDMSIEGPFLTGNWDFLEKIDRKRHDSKIKMLSEVYRLWHFDLLQAAFITSQVGYVADETPHHGIWDGASWRSKSK